MINLKMPKKDRYLIAKTNREQAERHDRLAIAAESDGDIEDAAYERNEAAKLRRLARQWEVE